MVNEAYLQIFANSELLSCRCGWNLGEVAMRHQLIQAFGGALLFSGKLANGLGQVAKRFLRLRIAQSGAFRGRRATRV